MTAATVTPIRQESVVPAPIGAMPDLSPEQRYLAVVESLLDEALEQQQVEPLVEALTWHLARIGYGYGTKAVADIVRRIGGHVCDIADEQKALAESKQAKKAGRKPQ